MILIVEIAIGVALGLALWNYRAVIMPVVLNLTLWTLGGALFVGACGLAIWAYHSMSAEAFARVGWIFIIVAIGRVLMYVSRDAKKAAKDVPIKYGPGPQ